MHKWAWYACCCRYPLPAFGGFAPCAIVEAKCPFPYRNMQFSAKAPPCVKPGPGATGPHSKGSGVTHGSAQGMGKEPEDPRWVFDGTVGFHPNIKASYFAQCQFGMLGKQPRQAHSVHVHLNSWYNHDCELLCPTCCAAIADCVNTTKFVEKETTVLRFRQSILGASFGKTPSWLWIFSNPLSMLICSRQHSTWHDDVYLLWPCSVQGSALLLHQLVTAVGPQCAPCTPASCMAAQCAAGGSSSQRCCTASSTAEGPVSRPGTETTSAAAAGAGACTSSIGWLD